MRRLVLLPVCVVLLFSFGCAKKEEEPQKPAQGRRMMKPGDAPTGGPPKRPGG